MKKIVVLMLMVAVVVSCSNDGPKNVKLTKGEKVVTSFANGTPQIVRDIKDVNGLPVPVYEKEYYEDGNLLKEGPIEKNNRHGFWKAYYRNGKIWNEGVYDHGVRDDSITGYYTNGNVKYKGVFDKGLKTGTWMYFDEDGELIENKIFMKPGEVREETISLQ